MAKSAITGRTLGPAALGEAHLVVNQDRRYARERRNYIAVEVALAGRRVELFLTPHQFRVAATRTLRNPEDQLASASLTREVVRDVLGALRGRR